MKIFNLLEEDWDTAVILDACRYDSFKSIYRSYLGEGKLEKRRGASCTTEWIKNTFPRNYPEIVYVSGNPWINSHSAWDGFDPRKKFEEIFDVWDWAWMGQPGTADPEEVTRTALEARKAYPQKRVIVHYLQPHYPYRKVEVSEEIKMQFDGVYGRDGSGDGFKSKFSDSLNRNFKKLFGKTWFWGLREMFSFGPRHVEEFLWRNFTEDQLREFYEDNLCWALDKVERLLDELEGELVITSDHGEAFGEGGEFFHPLGTTNSAVREVPFWRMEGA